MELHHSDQHELLQQLSKVNSKLVASENLKSNFLSNIRNEFNNPLASVLELSKNIAGGYLNAAQIKKFAELIHSEIFNLDFQLRNIFCSAELEAGELSFNVAAVKVTTIIQNVIGAFEHQAQKKKLTVLLTNGMAQDDLFYTDPEKLYLVISNLLANAIQFSREENVVEINSNIIDGQLKVSVLDYGTGICDESRPVIFDRFRQGEEGSTKNHSGHGLGLSVCNALLEMIQGEMIVESELLQGSTFTILVNGAAGDPAGTDVFSSDGNDFLFNDPESVTL
jgi:signal transduction histidine kinase